mmetsp:Transcript_61901/g.182838  ORF Transcript_61901/g.182838 Transcript_61901/m.182838 type:complete len:177 (-) Transcript_61901:275-805(-)
MAQSSQTTFHGGWNRDTGCPVHAFSLVVCRHPDTRLWLAVNENKGRGWWLPGGFVECGDDHFDTAIKETKEEAGVDVVLKGVLRVENNMTAFGGRQRVVFYAEPADLKQKPKDTPDKESQGAKWMSLEELREKGKLKPPKGLRGMELLDWANYLDRGGTIYPLEMLATEETPVPIP